MGALYARPDCVTTRAAAQYAGARRSARRAADHWGRRPPVLLRLGMNGIFNAGGVVLRVGRVTAEPAAAVERAEGVRAAPRPGADDRGGRAFTEAAG